MIELFSGIGAQKKGVDLTRLFDCIVLATSDIDKDAMISYAAIHNGLKIKEIESYDKYPSDEQMRQELIDKNIGYDFKKKSNPISKLKGDKLKKYYLAMLMSNNLGDISKINELPLADFWTYSFPCQDISIAGKQAGIIKGQTRSGLLHEVERLLEKAKQTNTLPKYLLLENVKNLVGKSFRSDFDMWLEKLDELGFNTYWSVINGKNCGVAQNRERTFAVSIRKDIDTMLFDFPKPFDNGLRLIDFLEETVDNKYYLSETAMRKFQLFNKNKGKDIKVAGSLNPNKEVQDRVRVLSPNGISQALRATDYKDPVKIVTGIDKSCKNTSQIEYANCITAREDRGVANYECIGTAILENKIISVGSINASQDGVVVNPNGISKTLTAGHNNMPKIIEDTRELRQLGQIYGTDTEPNPQAGRVYDANYISPTLDTCSGGNRMPKIVESGQFRPKDRNYNRHSKEREKQFETRKDDVSNALLTTPIKNCILEDKTQIRKLTPKECWRLMGFRDSDIDKAIDLDIANTHLYKQAGNSIITNCISLIMEHLYKAQYYHNYICFDENFTQPQVD